MTPNFEHLYSGWNIQPLLAAIQAHPELWDQSLKIWSNPKGPHAQAHSIWLRGENEAPYKLRGSYTGYNQSPHKPVWFHEYTTLTAVKPLIEDLMEAEGAESLGNVLIYNVPPGRRITPHADSSWSVNYNDKFNICLISNPAARFQYDDEAFVQKPGDVHFFRNDITHSVINDGDTDHIILCVCMHRER